jgi:hypothetical protein
VVVPWSRRLVDFDVRLGLSGVAVLQNRILRRPVPLHLGRRRGIHVDMRVDRMVHLMRIGIAQEYISIMAGC